MDIENSMTNSMIVLEPSNDESEDWTMSNSEELSSSDDSESDGGGTGVELAPSEESSEEENLSFNAMLHVEQMIADTAAEDENQLNLAMEEKVGFIIKCLFLKCLKYL